MPDLLKDIGDTPIYFIGKKKISKITKIKPKKETFLNYFKIIKF